MKKLMTLLFAVVMLFGAQYARATGPAGTLNVVAYNVLDSTGTPLVSGTVYFAPVDGSGNPLSYRLGSLGQAISSPVSAPIVNGAFSLNLPNVSLTNPVNVCFNTTIINNSNGQSVLGGGYTCVQPNPSLGWCNTTTCDFDNYPPNEAGIGIVYPATVSIGTVTTGTPGSSASATMSGTPSAAVLNLTLPQGIQGPIGAPTSGVNLSTTSLQMMLGPLNSAGFNGLVNAAVLTGSDIGAKINSFGPTGTLWIPEGTYSFSTPISITLTNTNNLHIICASHNTILNYTGTGDAVYVNGQLANGQFHMENCQLNGNSGATNGVHLFDTANARLTNMVVSGFTLGSGIYGQGSLLGMFIGNGVTSNKYGVRLQPDTTNNYAANRNSVIGGSLGYNTSFNFWDEGNSSNYGGDSSNVLDGVTLEENANVVQFLVEGTWNDAIVNSYIENNFGTSTSSLPTGIVGNIASSGYGSNATYTAVDFSFSNNYVTSVLAGSGFVTETLLAENTTALTVTTISDTGSPSYFVNFNASGTNSYTSIGVSEDSWKTAPYLNLPTDAIAWTFQQTPGSSGFTGSPTGLILGSLTTTKTVSNALIQNGAAPTVGSGQISIGATTNGAAACGSIVGAAGCIVFNLGGVTHYFPYW